MNGQRARPSPAHDHCGLIHEVRRTGEAGRQSSGDIAAYPEQSLTQSMRKATALTLWFENAAFVRYVPMAAIPRVGAGSR